MKSLILLILACSSVCSACGQTGNRSNSKHTTQVDSLSAPPRMDGNTGHYDTVTNPSGKSNDSFEKGKEYLYRRHVDTIGTKPKSRR